MTSSRISIFLTFLICACACSASDLPTWKPRNSVALGGSPRVIRYSPDGKLLVIGGSDGTLKIVSLETSSLVKTIFSDLKPISEIRFLSHSGRLLACGGENELRVFSIADGWVVVERGESIRACDVSEDEKLLVGGDGKKQGEALVLWSLGEMKLIRPPFSKGARPVDPAFVKGDRVAVAVARVPYLVDINTGQATKIQQAGDTATALKMEKGQGNQAAISLGSLQDDDAPTHSVVASRDGTLVALGRGWFGQPDFVDVWAASGMTRLIRIKEENTGTDASLSFDNQFVAVGASKPGTIAIFRIKDKKKTSIAGSNLFQFSPQSLEFAVIKDGTLVFYVPSK